MQPQKFLAKHLANWPVAAGTKKHGYIPARPTPFFYGISWEGWWIRFSLAWKVFTGRYDALDWQDRDN